MSRRAEQHRSDLVTHNSVSGCHDFVLSAQLTAVRDSEVGMLTAKAQLCPPKPGCRQGPMHMPLPGLDTLAESTLLW